MTLDKQKLIKGDNMNHKHAWQPTNKSWAISDKIARLFKTRHIYQCKCGHEVYWEIT